MIERVIYRQVGRTRVPFVSTDDLLVLKIVAGREKDLGDVRALLRAARSEIDTTLVRSRLAELGALIDDSSLVATFDALVTQAAPTKVGRKRRPPTRRRK